MAFPRPLRRRKRAGNLRVVKLKYFPSSKFNFRFRNASVVEPASSRSAIADSSDGPELGDLEALPRSRNDPDRAAEGADP